MNLEPSALDDLLDTLITEMFAEAERASERARCLLGPETLFRA